MASGGGRRWALAIGSLAIGLAGGCTVEAYKGPRVVPYSDTRFYLHHLPPLNGAATADEIAAYICRAQDAKTVLRDAYQDVPLDPRYSTYECI